MCQPGIEVPVQARRRGFELGTGHDDLLHLRSAPPERRALGIFGQDRNGVVSLLRWRGWVGGEVGEAGRAEGAQNGLPCVQDADSGDTRALALRHEHLQP